MFLIMKSYKHLFEKFISYQNLYLAYKNARKSKPNKKQVLDFGFNLEQNLFSIQEDIINNKYVVSNYLIFKIFEPKERIIAAPTFRDVVIQHAIINIIEPIFNKTFICDSFSCRKNKGIHKGLFRIKKIIQSQNHPKYYLKCDIKKYFPSINKNILKKMISKKIKDSKIITILYQIIDSYHSEYGNHKGIPIGNLTSQLFANIYLNNLDQFVKHSLKVKPYYRYVDDFILFSNSKKELNFLRFKIKQFLFTYLDLDMPKNKTYINLVEEGIDFVGYKIFPKKIKVRKINVNRFIKRTKENKYLYISKKIKKEYISFSISSFLGYCKHANANNLLNLIFENNFIEYKSLLSKVCKS